MAYIDGFEHDIFISYAHVDDLTASEDEEGWVTSFIEHLKVALGQRFGNFDCVKIWRDKRRLEGNHVFDEVIEIPHVRSG